MGFVFLRVFSNRGVGPIVRYVLLDFVARNRRHSRQGQVKSWLGWITSSRGSVVVSLHRWVPRTWSSARVTISSWRRVSIDDKDIIGSIWFGRHWRLFPIFLVVVVLLKWHWNLRNLVQMTTSFLRNCDFLVFLINDGLTLLSVPWLTIWQGNFVCKKKLIHKFPTDRLPNKDAKILLPKNLWFQLSSWRWINPWLGCRMLYTLMR